MRPSLAVKVFLSWSETRSKKVALALRDWLPSVINHVKPWMSEKDIAAGAHWSKEIAGSLEQAGFGIICVTPENRDRPWLLFEAGALAKAFDSARVVPYLFGYTDRSLPGSPLSQLQVKLTDKNDTFDLVKSINDTIGERGLDAQRLLKAFDKWWPDLETELGKIKLDDAKASPQPSTDDRLAELLDLARSQKAEIDAVHEAVRKLRPPSIAEVLDRPRGLALMRGTGNTRGIGGTVVEVDEPLGLLGDLRYGLRPPGGRPPGPRTKEGLIKAMDAAEPDPEDGGDDDDEPLGR